MRRSKEPLLWSLFSSGGTVAALFLPVIILLLWIATPLGWVEGRSYIELIDLVRHPIARLFVLVVITLSLFHWAHRFRYTLYDGLQLYHLNELIAVTTYGIATLLAFVATYIVWIVL